MSKLLWILIFVPSLGYASPYIGVPRIIDGDSLEVQEQTIRLYGIDAVERSQRCCSSDGQKYRCGRQATQALKTWINNRPISCVATQTDRYDRWLGQCSLGSRSINEWLVENGWAIVYSYRGRLPDNASDLIPIQRQAKNQRRGIWQGDFLTPTSWRRASSTEKLSFPCQDPPPAFPRQAFVILTVITTIALISLLKRTLSN